MDTAFVIPGINRRVGFDALIGLVPVIGDLAGMVISSFIVYEAKRLGAPRWLLARMGLNVAFDGLIGAVPVAGDLFDAAFKANRRNVRLLAPLAGAQRQPASHRDRRHRDPARRLSVPGPRPAAGRSRGRPDHGAAGARAARRGRQHG